MAVYTFETTTQAQAAGFTSNDFLVFSNSATTAQSLTVTSGAASGLNTASITLSNGTQSLTFSADQLSAASAIDHIGFNNASTIRLGTSPGTTLPSGGADNFGGTTGVDVIYGFAGNDTLAGAGGADYLYGGAAADSIGGGAGNDHIYGNSITSVAGAADLGDTIFGDAGSDYIQGNAGNDTINGGADSDRIFGGGDNDSIFGDLGNDTINGNLGDDTIFGGDNNDLIRGGQGADSIFGDAGDDILIGDLGNDTIQGNTGFDVLSGAAGNDTFVFTGTDANFNFTGNGTTTTAQGTSGTYTNGTTTTVTDLISDFQDGSDTIRLFGTTGANDVLHGSGAADNMFQAQQIASGLLAIDGGSFNVAAVTVGSDTYLFYNTTGTTTIDSAIKVQGVNDAQFSTVDFS